MSLVFSFLEEIISLWLEVSAYLLLGMAIAGLLHIFLGKAFIWRHLGKGGIGSIVKATLLGIPLPVCSCGVIPLASSLRKDGAHKSSVLSFMVATPTTGVDSILATYSLLGPLFAIFRPLGALASGISLGFFDYLVEGRKEKTRPVPKHSHPRMQPASRLEEFFRYAFWEIPQDIGKWLVAGTVIGAAIAAFAPQELFSQYFSYPWDFLIALLVGIPLYVCATGSIPVAVALLAKGFSPGAALIFLIVGPATNAITLSFVRARLGKKSFYIYLINIILVALGSGFLFNYLWNILGNNPALIKGGGETIPFIYKLISGIVLFILIAFSYVKKEKSLKQWDIEIYVPDIHCRHCKFTLESSCRELEDVENVFVDVDKKVIRIKGRVRGEKVLEQIRQSGYHPKEKGGI